MLVRVPTQAISATQEVSIIDVEDGKFSDATAAIEDIHTMFELEFASGALRATEYDTYEGESGLTFGTRYFTPSHVCRNDIGERLPLNIDPLGILTKAVGSRGKYLPENMVMYHQHKTTSSTTKYVQGLL